MQSADSSNSQKVLQTFEVLDRERLGLMDAEELREILQVFDREGLGFVDAVELRELLTSVGEKLSEDEVDELFRELEVDNEGKITLEALCQVFE